MTILFKGCNSFNDEMAEITFLNTTMVYLNTLIYVSFMLEWLDLMQRDPVVMYVVVLHSTIHSNRPSIHCVLTILLNQWKLKIQWKSFLSLFFLNTLVNKTPVNLKHSGFFSATELYKNTTIK